MKHPYENDDAHLRSKRSFREMENLEPTSRTKFRESGPKNPTPRLIKREIP